MWTGFGVLTNDSFSTMRTVAVMYLAPVWTCAGAGSLANQSFLETGEPPG